MINIHLVDDQKFINQSVFDFENHFQNQNIFILNSISQKEINYVNSHKKVFYFDYSGKGIIDFIHQKTQGKKRINIFVHYLRPEKACLLNKLRLSLKFSTYWIFYGIDLYKPLYMKGVYQLYDDQTVKEKIVFFFKNTFARFYSDLIYDKKKSLIVKFISELDFFCFWNPYDYELLKKNFKTKAIRKDFFYNVFSFGDLKIKRESAEVNCLINHSATATGNHLTLLHRLNSPEIKSHIKNLVVPLSYGDTKKINTIDEYCKKQFPTQYLPMLQFLDKDEYFKIINSVSVAFFGHRRQEAGGNIIVLLASGVKVFLREDNNLLRFFNEMGITIFSFENDFKSFKDLEVLDADIQVANRLIILKMFSEERNCEIYRQLITD